MGPKEKAISLSKQVIPAFRSKHAAVLYYKGRLLAQGFNKQKTHPIMMKYCKHPEAVYLHAEIDCIVKAINLYGTEILKESTLYVARTCKDGSLAASKPCEGCSKAIDAFGISKVYYTTQEGWRTI